MDVKSELKKWERDFLKKTGRRPNRKDIDADEQIRLKYELYTAMKKLNTVRNASASVSQDAWGQQDRTSRPKERLSRDRSTRGALEPPDSPLSREALKLEECTLQKKARNPAHQASLRSSHREQPQRAQVPFRIVSKVCFLL